MSNVKIAIINESTVMSDIDVQNAVAALQIQVTRDFAPAWKRDADLTFVPKGGTPDPDAWTLGIFDDSDQAGALGYHDFTEGGQPLAKVFANSDIQNGTSITVTMSHELLEMLVDPWIGDVVIQDNGDGTGRLVAKEVCDACEADQFGYSITVKAADGSDVQIQVSDFVFPAYFDQNTPSGAQLDFGRQIQSPFQILSGGYLGELPITEDPNGWTQVTAERTPHRVGNAAPLGSRRERRGYRKDWKKSTKRK